MRPEDAAILADSLVAADLAGTSTHGVSRLAIYIKRIEAGLIDPSAELTVGHSRAASLTVDCGNGLGQVQAVKVLDQLMPLAYEYGIAAATMHNSQHFGALSYYCNRVAAQDLILLAMTGCEPAMSPEGGCQPFFGTNPIAVSFPTSGEFPIKIDLSTSIIARGNIIAALKNGEPIPAGWALDSEGNPTTDASAALVGTVLTMAGHKGYALALMVEVFSSVLSGAAVGPQIGSMYKNLDRKQDVGHFFCMIDPAAFMEINVFKARLDDTICALKSVRRRPGVEELLVPGERAYFTTQRNQREGLLIDDATFTELRELSTRYRVNFDLEPADHTAH